MRRSVSLFSASLAVLSAGWAAYIVWFGGVDTTLLGVAIKSREPPRALVVSGVALALFAAANGFSATVESWSLRIVRADSRVLALILAIGTFVVGASFANTAATAADAFGYVSQVDLWLHRQVIVDQPWVREVPWPNAEATFAPLGYRPFRGPDGATPSIVPTYSPGYPLLMAASKLVAGYCSIFLVVPLMGGLLVWATYGLGTRVNAPHAGVIGAWLVATSPAFLFMLMPPMSDVPAAAMWALATYFILGTSQLSAIAAGGAASVAITIRPNLAPLAFVLWCWPLISRSSVPKSRARLIGFTIAASLGPLTIAAINTRLYGSPSTSGYGDLGPLFSFANVWPNVRDYVRWLVDSETPLIILGAAAAFAPVAFLWPNAKSRRVFWIFGFFIVVVWAGYFAYNLNDRTWWLLRLMLPSWPFIMLSMGAVIVAVARASRRPVMILLTIWLTVIWGAWGVELARFRGAFDAWYSDRRFIDVAMKVRERTPDSALVFTMLQSGSLRYYGGRQTLRFDNLPPDWLDRSVDWLERHNVHAYALFSDPTEQSAFENHFAGQRAATLTEAQMMFAYGGLAGEPTMRFYDLQYRASSFRQNALLPDGDLRCLRCFSPVVTAPLSFSSR
jgi:hypothetical protein